MVVTFKPKKDAGEIGMARRGRAGCPGGEMRVVCGSFIGPHAEAMMRRISAQRLFLGASGLVAGRGICEMTDAQASLKR